MQITNLNEVEHYGKIDTQLIEKCLSREILKSSINIVRQIPISFVTKKQCLNKLSIDLWGTYTREYPIERDCTSEKSQPRIFIWVDEIYDFVNGNSDNYILLTTQAILHQLAHAMMDVNLIRNKRPLRNLDNTFYTLKEESLANAISLMLLKDHIDNKSWEFLVSFIKQQPIQYALNLDYLANNGHLIITSMDEWMSVKADTLIVYGKCSGYYSKDVAREWINYVQSARPLDWKQLQLLDIGMIIPHFIYKYKGRFLNSSQTAIQVIKDYMDLTPNITRDMLHTAFPDDLNEYYESIIDYPEQDHFTHKKFPVDTECLLDENIVTCVDGKAAICEDWHTYHMDKFVANANMLGFTIECFK